MKKERHPGVLARLFVSMLGISAFTFGGGYVIVSLMKKKFVDEYGWLSEQESWTLLRWRSPVPVQSRSMRQFWRACA